MWSKWQWVSRIASTSPPICSAAARIRSASSPGSTISSRSPPCGRSKKQFSPMAPTVSISTSSAMALLPAGADPLPLAPPPEGHVDEVAGGDVEDEHEGAERERDTDRTFEDQQQQHGEDDGGGEPAHDRAAPGRRQVGAGSRFAFGS